MYVLGLRRHPFEYFNTYPVIQPFSYIIYVCMICIYVCIFNDIMQTEKVLIY